MDVILHIAGIIPLYTMDRFNVDEWDQMVDVNIKGALNGFATVLPHMKNQKSGHIIHSSSVAGHKIFNSFAVYAATKFAVRSWSEGFRMEVKPYTIRTTKVCPGAVRTELLTHPRSTGGETSLAGARDMLFLNYSEFGNIFVWAIP